MFKRFFDLIISITLFIILLPIFISVSLTILFINGKPIFFVQKRVGLYGKSFKIYKFRTMENSKSFNNNILSDTNRVTSLGSFLRHNSLDELPSLLNVIKGEMSLVGPRPLLLDYLPLYTKQQLRRHDVKPGITGWAQINGRNLLSWEEKFIFDIWYVDNHNLLLDVKILFSTFYKVLSKEGILTKETTIMPKFKGSNEKK